MSDAPEISAVITCYYEEATIDEFHRRLSDALEKLGRSYEMVFINDGSTDGTYEKLKAIFARDPHVRAVADLFKNAGQAAAITAGICESGGSIILSIDSDLQLNPAELPLLMAEYDKGYDVVSGSRKNRRDPYSRILPSKIANMIIRKASGAKLSDFGCTFKLYNAELVRAFDLGPMLVFNPVTVISRAQRVIEVSVSHSPRKFGKSGWTFKKLWAYQMEHLVSLSERPFQYLAFLVAAFAVLLALRVAVDAFAPFRVLHEVSNGLILNVSIITFLLMMSVACIIGEFSIRAFMASRHVPSYVVRSAMRRKPTIRPVGSGVISTESSAPSGPTLGS